MGNKVDFGSGKETTDTHKDILDIITKNGVTMASILDNELCSKYVTGDCDKEVLAVCGRFFVEVVLSEPYMIFDCSDAVEVDDGRGEWYQVEPSDNIIVSAHDDEIGTDKIYKMYIRSDSVVDWIRFVSDTYIEINLVSCDDLITGDNMFTDLELLEKVNINGFNQMLSYINTFSGCLNLTYVNNFFVIPENEFGVTSISFQSTFYGCKNMTYIPNIDFSHAIDMDYTFYGMKKLINANDITLLNSDVPFDHTYESCFLLVDIPRINYENIGTSFGLFKA